MKLFEKKNDIKIKEMEQ